VSPHLYNNSEEIGRLVGALGRYLKSGV